MCHFFALPNNQPIHFLLNAGLYLPSFAHFWFNGPTLMNDGGESNIIPPTQNVLDVRPKPAVASSRFNAWFFPFPPPKC